MEILIEDAGAQELFAAIEASPFSLPFRQAFCREILATVGVGFGHPGLEGLFDSSDVSALATGDWCVRVGLTTSGKLLAAALRTLAPRT
jgi:hypothetical protein